MEVDAPSHRLYGHIKSYQTRIIRLHSRNEDEESAITCDVFVASLIDSHFEGLAVEGSPEEEQSDDIVQYDALSWVWGPAGATQKDIVCNGVNLPIPENLYAAMRELQPLQSGDVRYLWVDRICIAQFDDKEKSFQVANMYLIYRKARTVFAWLGPEHEHTRLAAQAILSRLTGPSETQLMCDDDFWKVYTGLHDLLTRSRFQRVWVQQEMFVARDLHLRCGQFRIYASELRNLPNHWLTGSPIVTESKEGESRPLSCREFPESADSARERAIGEIKQTWQDKLYCFCIFTTPASSRPDFVETLLRTSHLEATDPRDRIYSILQMTEFPSRAASVVDWIQMRHKETFLPIDYAASLHDLLCAVTWVLLMKCGLSMLVKFKAFSAASDKLQERSLPSWVIDWRLASTFLVKWSEKEVKLGNPWDHRDRFDEKLETGEPTDAHHQFCADNLQAPMTINKVIVHGKLVPGLSIEAGGVYIRRKHRVVWNTGVLLHADDVIVSTSATEHLSYPTGNFLDSYAESSPFWLLRPAGNEEYRLVACLSGYDEMQLSTPYSHWSQVKEDLTHRSSSGPFICDYTQLSGTRRAFTYSAILQIPPFILEEELAWHEVIRGLRSGGEEQIFTIV